jgi:basic membrane protein A
MIITFVASQNPATAVSPTAYVGLVVDANGVTDNGWNELAFQGLLKAETDLGVQGTVYSGSDYANQLALCAAAQELCVVTGWDYFNHMETAALAHPAVQFAFIDGFSPEISLPNLRWVTFEEKEVGYLAGALAGKMTTSNIIGAVGGIPIPPVVNFLEGYENGAQCANNSIRVLEKYAESFTDPGWGYDRAMEMIDTGADVLFGAGGETGNGAILYSATHDVMTIGVDTDQWITKWHGDTATPEDGHEYILTSAMKRLDNAVQLSVYDLSLIHI